MARHNRTAEGNDQRGQTYRVEYQPDWLYQVKVTRDLEHGRQSTKTLYRNEEPSQAEPGAMVRTRIQSEALNLDFEIAVRDPDSVVRRVIVETIPKAEGHPPSEPVSFVIQARRKRTGEPQGSTPATPAVRDVLEARVEAVESQMTSVEEKVEVSS